MEYLSSKKVIHRDLAARNILVSETNICKVRTQTISRHINVVVASLGRFLDQTHFDSH